MCALLLDDPKWKKRRSLTSAGVGRSAVVELWQTGLAAAPPGVVDTLETFARAAITASWSADADVPVALAGPAGSLHAAHRAHRVAIETLLTDVTAGT